MDEEPTAVTGVVMPPVSATQRDALLHLKAQVERTTAAHEQVGVALDAAARGHRNLGRAVNDLLAAITGVLKAQEADSAVLRNDRANDRFPECPGCGAPPGQAHSPLCNVSRHPQRDTLLATVAQDRIDNPRGHPCRNCGWHFDEHPVLDGDMHCKEWR